MTTIQSTQFQFPGQSSFYRGKVRDVYTLGDGLLVMVATDRISAFDVVLPRAIPYKGQVLNQIAVYMLSQTTDIVPNWSLLSPDPNITIGHRCEPLRVEMVIRGYLSGHAWRTYKSGLRELCGVKLPDGLHENDPLPEPIITPTTKAVEGHDEDISREQIIQSGYVSVADFEALETYTRRLFQRGSEIAARHGLILVDTKYEFGKLGNQIMLMDEIHTPDSSRYFYAEGYEERQKNGEQQRQLSKEFVREWLISEGFMGKEGQSVPTMSDEWIHQISSRYIELYEIITGEQFQRQVYSGAIERMHQSVLNFLNTKA